MNLLTSKVQIWLLENWCKCGLSSQPQINKLDCHDIYMSVYYTRYNVQYTEMHKSLRAAKTSFRREHSVKGKTPRYKWIKVIPLRKGYG